MRTRYIDVGEGQWGTILLMHGIPTWGYLYHAVIPCLAGAGYRVIALDFLGHGWSDRRDRFNRSFQGQARVIIGLFSTLGLERVDVVGHATGGAVALILAIEHSGIVGRLAISNSVCYDWFDEMLDLGHPGFTVLPKRWLVERTHAWIEKARRLVMHHDRHVEVSEAWVWLAAGRQLLNRLTRLA